MGLLLQETLAADLGVLLPWWLFLVLGTLLIGW
jgi:hypothetical protein